MKLVEVQVIEQTQGNKTIQCEFCSCEFERPEDWVLHVTAEHYY